MRRAVVNERCAVWFVVVLVGLVVPASARGQATLERFLHEAAPIGGAWDAAESGSRFPALDLEPAARTGSRVGEERDPHPDGSSRRAAGSAARDHHGEQDGLPRARPEGPEHAAASRGEPGRSGSWLGSELADGRYEVVDTLREGEEGIVYLAHDLNLDAHVEVEVPRGAADADPDSAIQFVRDARGLARLEHPHLVRVTAIGTHHDAPFLITEHFSGGSLRFRRPVGPDGRPAPAAPATLGQWLAEVAAALDYLRSQDRVHGRLTPASILFDAQGRPYLGGFGLSQAVACARVQDDTRPPEEHADQRALAATVYEMLSGRTPGRGPTSAPPDLRRACPSIPAALASVVMRGMSRNPSDRFADCSSFARAALSAAREPSPPDVSATGTPSRVETRRPERVGGLAAGAAVTLAWSGERPRSYVALGVAGSMMLVVAGTQARRKRPHRRAPSTTAPSRQVVGRRLRKLAALVGCGEPPRRPGLPVAPPARGTTHEAGPPGRIPSLLAGHPVASAADKVLGHPSLGKALCRNTEPDEARDVPRVPLARRLLPLASSLPVLSFLRPAQPPATRRRRAS